MSTWNVIVHGEIGISNSAGWAYKIFLTIFFHTLGHRLEWIIIPSVISHSVIYWIVEKNHIKNHASMIFNHVMEIFQ